MFGRIIQTLLPFNAVNPLILVQILLNYLSGVPHSVDVGIHTSLVRIHLVRRHEVDERRILV